MLQPARHSKLEKADILEMTVKYLQNLQRQQTAISTVTDPATMGKFRAGFNECASEVGRFPGLETSVKRRLLQHLANCLNQVREQPQETAQVQILPKPVVEVEVAPQQLQQHNGILLSNLLPTRLPNGDLAFVLPTATATTASPLPLLVPIPTRTPSNASATSSTSCSSRASTEPLEVNPVQFEYVAQQYSSPPMQKPLSLVVNKSREPVDEEKPWRPWWEWVSRKNKDWTCSHCGRFYVKCDVINKRGCGLPRIFLDECVRTMEFLLNSIIFSVGELLDYRILLNIPPYRWISSYHRNPIIWI